MKTLIIASYDSFLTAGARLASRMEEHGVDVDVAVLRIKPNQVASRQMTEAACTRKVFDVSFDSLANPTFMGQYEGYVLSIDGPSCKRLFMRLSICSGYRPAILTLYPGLVFRFDYDGFSARAPSDLVWLNSQKDLEKYRALTSSLGKPDNGRNFGLATLLDEGAASEMVKCENRPSKTIVFFEQVVIPSSKADREILVRLLLDLAKKYSEHKILVKPRMKPKEKTIHKLKADLHIEKIFQRQKESIPSNIQITYQRAGSLLMNCDACLTISSTVAIEAIHRGVRPVIINDFGFHDDSGVPFFLGSGLISSLADIDVDKLAEPNPAWLSDHFTEVSCTAAPLLAEFMQLAKSARENHLPPIDVSPWLGSEQVLAELRSSYSDDDIALGWYRKPGKKLPIKVLSDIYQAFSGFFR
ncbi:hypothetical protein GCM10007094_37220 [Pseudovibrio japonicus]|uniref:Uncharacterized protein n=1 Tax=Pseudovibrio japonicus TaxID=366534 RepID=A0ABQ3EKJ2_9HYPH|nr:DUF6716 putative glycosyltransferase [Pseudovibrio japonicus]GHB44450.1 hypothetical protein GCM10007094_37220 [Pseudovibrio japonicus]